MILRVVTGIIIALHSLWRIIFLNKYVDFVQHNFYDLLPNDTLLIVGSTLFLHLEFFVGLLIILKVKNQLSIFLGVFISLTMIVFITAQALYPHLIYHGIVIGLLAMVYYTQLGKNQGKLIL